MTRRASEFALTVEPELEVYFGILDHALSTCESGLLVVRKEMPLTANGSEFIQLARKCSPEQVKETSEWPGTRLLGETATAHQFAYTPELVSIMKRFSHRLFQWVQPELPEDLCLLQAENRPWLVSIAHERDAYFLLEESQFGELSAAVPSLVCMLARRK